MTQLSWLLDVPAQQIFRDGTLVEPTVRRWDFFGFNIAYNALTGRVEIRGGGSPDWKESVRAATTVALPANTRTGNTLTATANGAFPALDGVTLAVGQTLLVKNEALGANNGIFRLDNAGSGSTQWQASRHILSDESSEVTPGLQVYVEEGSTQGGQRWRLTNVGTITLNTTALTFVLDSGTTGAVILGRTVVTFAMSAYTPIATDSLLACNSSGGPIIISLPAVGTLAVGRSFQVVDETGNAGANNVTIDPAGAELIDGAATYALAANFAGVAFYNTGTGWKVLP